MPTNEAIGIIIVKTNTRLCYKLRFTITLPFFIIGARIKILIVSVFKINACSYNRRTI